MTAPDIARLTAPIDAGALHLEMLAEQHRELLRDICPEDDAILKDEWAP